jgi:outer membrane protein TolC
MERKIIREVKSAYYDLYFIQKKIALNNENQELTRKFESVAKTQYEVGMGTQADILRSQTELSMLINEENNLKIEKKLAETSINILLYRNPDDQVGLIKNIKKNLMEFEYAKLMPLAIKNNSELNEIRQNIEMNNAEIMMAKREYYPDLMFRIMYKDMADTSDDFFSSMFAVNIPLAFWSAGKYKGKVDEETEKLKKTKEDLRAAENMLNLKVREALYGIKTGLNSMLLYENTVIPQANQTLISTLAAYQTGRAEFFSLIEACRTLLAAKQDFYMSEVNYMSNIAALEESVGLNIDEIEQNIK